MGETQTHRWTIKYILKNFDVKVNANNGKGLGVRKDSH